MDNKTCVVLQEVPGAEALTNDTIGEIVLLKGTQAALPEADARGFGAGPFLLSVAGNEIKEKCIKCQSPCLKRPMYYADENAVYPAILCKAV